MTNIPAIEELSGLPQWVVWRTELREKKPTKVLFNIDTGTHASSTDPTTWSTYEHALETAPNFEGIGFVFAAEDPYTGVDLDKSVDADGNLLPWAHEIVDALDSYTEYSPSGTGVHIWIRAKLPPGRRRKGHIEMYDRARYFTVTGKPFPGCRLTIESRQSEIEAIHAKVFPAVPEARQRAATAPVVLDDQNLLERACKAHNGHSFGALYGGDTSQYGGDNSSADLALCNGLAFWSGCDVSQMDRLFRSSGLMRAKWDERRGELTYGQRTIQCAVDGCEKTYSPPDRADRSNGNGSSVVADYATTVANSASVSILDAEDERLRPLTLEELFAKADEVGGLRWLVPNGIARGHVHLLSAPPKSGKTWFGLTLARAVCQGTPWAGADGIEQGAVLWIDEEMGAPLLARRLHQLEMEPGIPFYTLSLAGFRLDQGGDVARVIAAIETHDIALVIVDSLRRVHRLDENDNSEMRNLLPMMHAIAAAGPAVVVLHHDRKRTLNDSSEQERSSGALDLIAQVDMVFGMKRDRDTFTLTCRSARLIGEEQAASIAFRLSDRADGTVAVEPLSAKDAKANSQIALETAILFHLTRNPGDNSRGVCEAISGRDTETRAALARMVDDGRVTMERGARSAKCYRCCEPYALSEPEYGDPLAD